MKHFFKDTSPDKAATISKITGQYNSIIHINLRITTLPPNFLQETFSCLELYRLFDKELCLFLKLLYQYSSNKSFAQIEKMEIFASLNTVSDKELIVLKQYKVKMLANNTLLVYEILEGSYFLAFTYGIVILGCAFLVSYAGTMVLQVLKCSFV